MDTSKFVCLLSVTLAAQLFAACTVAHAQGEAVAPAPIQKSKVDEAVDKGLQYLASIQQPDGSFSKITGLSAVAVMSFLASGHVPGEGPYHKIVERGLAHIVRSQDPKTGYFPGGNGRMYGHGMCALLLGEVVGMTHDDSVKRVLPKAIQVILNAQAVKKPGQFQGGWRYEPNSGDSDMSVTGWQMIALRAARDSGINVPKPAIDEAVHYVKVSSAPTGGFGYQGPHPTPSTTAIALVALQMAGEYDAPEVWKGADYFLRNPWHSNPWFFYTIYYGTFAMYQCGGKYWEIWEGLLERAVLPLQRGDGSWLSGGGNEASAGGPVYCTSMALLALSVQYHYLPAYQR